MSTFVQDNVSAAARLIAVHHSRGVRRWNRVTSVALVLLATLLGGCAFSVGQSTTSSSSGRAFVPALSSHAGDDVVLAVLHNIQANGFNADPSINGGLGGLYVNWRFGTHPLQTNFNGSGETDAESGMAIRHDALTDERYLHALLLYTHLHPTAHEFAHEIAQYTAIVKAEYVSARNDHAWLYDEFADLYRLTEDAFYQSVEVSLANYFATTLYHVDTASFYKLSSDQPDGYYRVDFAVEAGCALLQAGVSFHRPDWSAEGAHILDFVYGHAYVASAHAFVEQMSNVLLPDGSLNPTETIERGLYGHTHIEGGSVRMGEVAQIILSLLHAYIDTHDASLLSRAEDLITPLTAGANTLGLWDPTNLGYFAAAVFPGPDVAHAGTARIQMSVKESGRQIQMLEVFRVANALTGGRYQTMQDMMLVVATQRAYYAPGHGFLFQMTSGWQPAPLKNGQLQDWVTTEAMGIATLAILSTQDSTPW